MFKKDPWQKKNWSSDPAQWSAGHSGSPGDSQWKSDSWDSRSESRHSYRSQSQYRGSHGASESKRSWRDDQWVDPQQWNGSDETWQKETGEATSAATATDSSWKDGGAEGGLRRVSVRETTDRMQGQLRQRRVGSRISGPRSGVTMLSRTTRTPL